MDQSSSLPEPVALATDLPWFAAVPAPLDDDGPKTVPFTPFQAGWVERPALELFAAMVARHPDNFACEDADTALTFAEVWAASRRLAATIDSEVAAGAPVGVLLPNQASYAVAVLACLGAARPCVLIDRNFPQDRVGRIVRDAGLGAVVLRRADIEQGYLLPAGVPAIELDRAFEDGAIPDGMPAKPPPPDAASFVVYTSGSTGAPKGIVLSQRGVLHRAAELVNAVHLHPADKVLSLASPGTIGGLQQIFEVMLSGASLVKLDLQRLGLGEVVRIVARRRISMMFSTPAVWRSVARLAGVKEMLTSLRCIQSSGDTLLRIDYDQLREVLPPACHVLSVYGATEAPALLQSFVATPPDDEVRIPAGHPLPGLSLALLDEQDRPVADGQPGELVIRSRFTALGLWQGGRVVRGPLLADPGAPELNIYRTGDLVRRRVDGSYVVLGRRDRQVKVLGNRVELAEIETELRRAPGVLDAAAVASRGAGEPQLLGFVVPRPDGDRRLLDSVRRHLETTLPAYMRPRQLITLDSLPLLPGRKIDEDALLARVAPPGAPHAGSATDRPTVAGPSSFPPPSPSRRTLRMVEQAWRAALGRPPPRTAESFERAGGDSLQFLQLIFELERLIGRPLPMERFHGRLDAPGIADALEACLGAGDGTLTATEPAVFLFPPGSGGDAYLTAFRATVAGHLTVRQVRYPDLRTLAQPETAFEAIAAHAARQIESAKPQGPLLLAGYSDGGDVAWAAARQLRASGRTVASLLVLDTDASGLSYPAPAATPEPAGARLRRYFRLPAIRHYRRLVEMFVPAPLLRTARGQTLLRALLALRLPLPAPIAFVATLKAANVLFNEKHRHWFGKPAAPALDVPVLLFRSQEPRPGAPDDLGWRRRTTALAIVPVPGDHSTMLEGDRSIAIAARIAEVASRPSPLPAGVD